VLLVGSIELLVMAGTFLRQWTVMVKFLVVDRPLTYNVVIGRKSLNKLKAMTSTPHLCMKISTNEGVGMVKGDQTTARYCYNTSLKGLPKQASLGQKTKEDGKYQP
jgi:hypothetical protein